VVVPIGGKPRVGLDDIVGDLGCCDNGLHCGQLGNNKDGSHGGDSSTMVGATATTTTTLGRAPLWHNTDGLPTLMPQKVAIVGRGRGRRQPTRAGRR
jgi:hypothetical protein